MMKKDLSRIVSLILLGGLAVSTASCGDTTGNETKTSSENESTTTADNTPESDTNALPEADFGGYAFRVAHWCFPDRPAYNNRDLIANSETGDKINDAVYKRNMEVFDKYNFSIELTNLSYDKITDTVRSSIMSGDDEFDLVMPRLYEGKSLITEGLLVDFNDIPNIDLSNDWWDMNITSSLSVNGKYYYAASDMNLGDKDATAMIMFNKTIADNNNVEDLYKLVEDGKWTIDKMREIYSPISSDLDGNGMDLDDMWGFLGANDVPPSFFIGGGGTFVSYDSNGRLVDSFNTEHNISLTDKIHNMMNDPANFYNHHLGTGKAKMTVDADFLKMFAEGRGLLFWSRFDSVTQLRDQDVDYGILPIPKYDEAQDNYISFVSQHICGLMSVPATNKDLERTGIILDALSRASGETIITAYYDVTLKDKLLRDEKSVEMLDLIFDNRRLDMGEVYDFGGWSSKYIEVCATDKYPVVSTYSSYQSKISEKLTSFVEAMD